MHAHAYTHAHKHTHVHTRTRACIHAHTPASSSCSALLWTIRGTSLNLVSSELYSLWESTMECSMRKHTHTKKLHKNCPKEYCCHTCFQSGIFIKICVVTGLKSSLKSNYLHLNLLSYLIMWSWIRHCVFVPVFPHAEKKRRRNKPSALAHACNPNICETGRRIRNSEPEKDTSVH